MYGTGKRISEVIKMLQKAQDKYGDIPVYSGGTDYPEGVEGVHYERTGNAYVPANSLEI